MANRQVKLNVNGMNYVITGVDKSTSYKDILCTIAKQTKDLDSKQSCNGKRRKSDAKKNKWQKPERQLHLNENEIHELKKIKYTKIIYIGQEEGEEKVGRKKGGKRNLIEKDEIKNETRDDSDVELFHKSRRRMKNIMKKKWRDESDIKIYDNGMGGISLKSLKPGKEKIQGKSCFMDDFDKISIYYLNEKSIQPRIEDRLRSNGSISMGGLLSKTSPGGKATQRKQAMKPLKIDCKSGDDKDSGIPSWESEEMSSKDDNKIEHNEKTLEYENIERTCNEISNQKIACLGVCEDQRKDFVIKKINHNEMLKRDTETIAECGQDIKIKEGKKSEGENHGNQNLPGCFSEIINTGHERCPEFADKNIEDNDSISDFEIIKTDQVSLESKGLRLGSADKEKSQLRGKENNSDKQRRSITFDINANELNNSEKVCRKEKKFNLENRGSFILIELDENVADCKIQNKKAEDRNGDEFTDMRQKCVYNDIKGVSQLDILSMNLEMGQQCSTPLINFDKEGPVEKEGEERSNRGKDWQRKNEASQVIGNDNATSKVNNNVVGGKDANGNEQIEAEEIEENENDESNTLKDQLVGGNEANDNNNMMRFICNCEDAIQANNCVMPESCYTVEKSKRQELISKFVCEFAKEVQNTMTRKFEKHGEKEILHDCDNKEVNSGDGKKRKKEKERTMLWKEYVEICEKIYKISEKLLYLDMMIVQKKTELEELKEMENLYDDKILEKDENIIVKELVEFRRYLKKVTIASRKNRMEMKENRKIIEETEMALAMKRPLLRSLEQFFICNRSEKIPRNLIKGYNGRKRRRSLLEIDNNM